MLTVTRLCLGVWLVVASSVAFPLEPASDMLVDVFQAGQGDYNCYRIPALLQTGQGVLMLFVEGRRFSCADHGWNDVIFKRSHDGGRTWEGPFLAHGESTSSKNVTIGNPAPIMDSVTGRIALFLSRNNEQVLVVTSDDLGASWSPASEQPQLVKSDWTWVATGPPGGIQTSDGSLVVAADHNTQAHAFSHLIISRDHGATWQLGGSVENGNEAQVAETANGRLVLNMRMASSETQHSRQIAWSDDGGASFVNVSAWGLDPHCEGSMISARNRSILLSSNAHNASQRVNMTVLASRDQGATWTDGVQMWDGPSAYSTLAEHVETGNTVLAFERGQISAYERISVAILPTPTEH